jgi:hypothetical protein
MDEYMRDILEDALHLSHDEGQTSDDDYYAALEWIQENSEGM